MIGGEDELKRDNQKHVQPKSKIEAELEDTGIDTTRDRVLQAS